MTNPNDKQAYLALLENDVLVRIEIQFVGHESRGALVSVNGVRIPTTYPADVVIDKAKSAVSTQFDSPIIAWTREPLDAAHAYMRALATSSSAVVLERTEQVRDQLREQLAKAEAACEVAQSERHKTEESLRSVFQTCSAEQHHSVDARATESKDVESLRRCIYNQSRQLRMMQDQNTELSEKLDAMGYVWGGVSSVSSHNRTKKAPPFDRVFVQRLVDCATRAVFLYRARKGEYTWYPPRMELDGPAQLKKLEERIEMMRTKMYSNPTLAAVIAVEEKRITAESWLQQALTDGLAECERLRERINGLSKSDGDTKE